MIIVKRKSRKERRAERRAKAGGKPPVLAWRLGLLALIAGLLFFFVYTNADYFLSMGEVIAEKLPRKADRLQTPVAAAPREYRAASDILGESEFSPNEDDALLAHLSTVLRMIDTARMPMRILRPPYLPETEIGGDTDEAAATIVANADGGAVTADNWEPPTAAAPVERQKPPAPAPARRAAATLKAADTADGAVTASEAETAKIIGSFVLPDIMCRLADRDDLRISLSVELFYDSDALGGEIRFKRRALSAMVSNAVRKYEYGAMTVPSLRGELLSAFNGVLKEGPLPRVDIRDFRVEQVALNNK